MKYLLKKYESKVDNYLLSKKVAVVLKQQLREVVPFFILITDVDKLVDFRLKLSEKHIEDVRKLCLPVFEKFEKFIDKSIVENSLIVLYMLAHEDDIIVNHKEINDEIRLYRKLERFINGVRLEESKKNKEGDQNQQLNSIRAKFSKGHKNNPHVIDGETSWFLIELLEHVFSETDYINWEETFDGEGRIDRDTQIIYEITYCFFEYLRYYGSFDSKSALQLFIGELYIAYKMIDDKEEYQIDPDNLRRLVAMYCKKGVPSLQRKD